MAITAQSIVRRAVETLQDTNNVRWSIGELVRYLNDGQREIATTRPDATATTISHALVAGTKQAIPTTGSKLISVVRNTGGSKRSIRMTNRVILDAQVPDWHDATGVTEIIHYMYDVREPKVFYVYPPAASSGASVELVHSAYPADITEPGAGTSYTDVAGNISVADQYANALNDYILFRAYTKDAEYAANAARAQAHYGAFSGALGVEFSGTTGVTPKA